MSVRYQSDEEPPTYAPAPRQPIPLITLALIAAIGVVFLVQVRAGFEASFILAGFDKAGLLQKREYWRILTGATLHGGPLHVFMNCFAFYNLGRPFEQISNRMHVATVFLLAAIGGNVLSLVFLPEVTAVGASGGIIGLLGYLLAYTFRRRQFVSKQFRNSLLVNTGFILIVGVILNQQGGDILVDNYGHIGGLIVGLLYGLIQIPSDEYSDPRQGSTISNTFGLGSLGVYLAGCVFSILLILRIV